MNYMGHCTSVPDVNSDTNAVNAAIDVKNVNLNVERSDAYGTIAKETPKERRLRMKSVLVEGDMYKRSQSGNKGFRKRYMVLRGNGDFSYHDTRDDFAKNKAAKWMVNMVQFVKDASEQLEVLVRDEVYIIASLKSDVLFELKALSVEDAQRLFEALEKLSFSKPLKVTHV